MNKSFIFFPTDQFKVPEITAASSWHASHLFNAYRLVLSFCFLLMFQYGTAVTEFLGRYYKNLFLTTSLLYFFFSILCIFTIHQRLLSFRIQTIVQVLVDIVAVTIIMHASGGFYSGLGTFLILSVIGGGLLTEKYLQSGGRIAFFFAATASLAVLSHVAIANIHDFYPLNGNNYSQAGLLGIAFFSTALLIYVLAIQRKGHAQLAEQRRIILHQLAKLDKELTPGILFIDTTARIRFANQSAYFLLGWQAEKIKRSQNGLLVLLAPELSAHLDKWQDKSNKPSLFSPPQLNSEVLATFTKLDQVGTFIILEDAARITQRAQEVKLVALGRLTAAIAHEIRNPLSAVSQAGQLLEESVDLSEKNMKLVKIILRNSKRINGMIESVLQLGQRKDYFNIDAIDLIQWIQNFVAEFINHKQLNKQTVIVDVPQTKLLVKFDPEQLYQVVHNLCENGLRVALRKNSENSYFLTLKVNSIDNNTCYLTICDQGTGIEETAVQYIFEPFFTTENKKTIENMGKGVGLGLYIAKEICEANHATLHLLSTTPNGCCFQIIFAVTH